MPTSKPTDSKGSKYQADCSDWLPGARQAWGAPGNRRLQVWLLSLPFMESQLCSGHSLLYLLAKEAHCSPNCKCIFSMPSLVFVFLQFPSLSFTIILFSTVVHPGPTCPCDSLSQAVHPVWFGGSDFLKGESDWSDWLSLYVWAKWLQKVWATLYGSWSHDLHVGRGMETGSHDTTQPPGSGDWMRLFPTEGEVEAGTGTAQWRRAWTAGSRSPGQHCKIRLLSWEIPCGRTRRHQRQEWKSHSGHFSPISADAPGRQGEEPGWQTELRLGQIQLFRSLFVVQTGWSRNKMFLLCSAWHSTYRTQGIITDWACQDSDSSPKFPRQKFQWLPVESWAFLMNVALIGVGSARYLLDLFS